MFQQSEQQGNSKRTILMVRELGVRSRRGIGRLLFFLSLLMGMTSFAVAQTGQGAIAGRVTDATGAVVQKANVQVTNTETQVSLTTKTNSDGVYSVQSLNPGDYTVTVSGQGFETSVTNEVIVHAAQQPTINVSLKVGKESSEVTVVAQDALLSTDTSDVTTTVDHKIVEDLPYPDRSSLEAVLLVPGVTGDPSVPGGVFSENPVITTGAVVPGASISVGGAAPGTTPIMVDGSDVTQASYARSGINLSGQIVQETTVITSGLSAQYGRTSAGAIVQTTKSGTNQYHGGVTWRHTDPFFNAWPLGTTAPSDLHENYFGAYVGGPVWIPKVYDGHGKTFFFVGVEPARLDNKQGYRGAFDTPDDLAGHLYNSYALLNQTTLKNSGYAVALAAARTGSINYQTTYDLTTGIPNGAYDTTKIKPVCYNLQSNCAAQTAGGIDDVSAILVHNSFAQLVTSLLPTPSNPGPFIRFDNAGATYDQSGNNASYLRGVFDVDNRYSVRIDHQFGNSDQMWGRYTNVPITGTRVFALSLDNTLNQVPTDKILSQDVAIGYTHVFSGSLVNELHYSFLRVNEKRLPYEAALSKDWAGSNGLTPAVLGKGFPNLGTLGTGTLQVGAETPYGDVDENFILGDNVTWTRGTHVLQFGADFRWIQSNEYDPSLQYGGKYTFGANQTQSAISNGKGGDALATFMLGEITTYAASPVAVPGYYRWKYFAGYFQDNWHALPKLTLNLGLRYDVAVPREEKFNNQPIFLPSASGTSSSGVSATGAFCFSGQCGLGRSLWPTNWYGLEPRVGIDFAPTPRTTLRASYGLMRLPLSGYEISPDPDLNTSSTPTTYTSGGTNPLIEPNYLSNPVAPLTSAYTALNGGRGPFYAPPGISPAYVSPSTSVPYSQTWNFTVQYEPTSKTLVQVTYQGLKGTHLIGPTNGNSSPNSPFASSLNLPSLSTLTGIIQNHASLSATPTNAYFPNGGNAGETGLQAFAPYQNFWNSPLTQLYPRTGTSEYNGLYVSAVQRYASGLSLLAYYTWTKSLDNVADTNYGNSGDFGTSAPQNPNSSAGEYSVSSFDQPSRLKAGYVYELPIGKGKLLSTHHDWLNNVIGNMSTSGIMTIASGFPNYVDYAAAASLYTNLGNPGNWVTFPNASTPGCTPTTGNTYCAGQAALPPGYVLRPNLIPGVPLINPAYKHTKASQLNPFGLPQFNGGSFTPYLNPAAFGCTANAAGAYVTCNPPGSPDNPQLGNAPRTLAAARSPREFMFDARFTKGFQIGSRYELKAFVNLNNAFNHPVYFAANNTANDPLTNGITTTSTSYSGPTPTFQSTFNATQFGHLNVNTGNLSRVIRVGAEFTF